MSCSHSDRQLDPVLAGVAKPVTLSPDLGALSLADLPAACATRSALLAALSRLPEADPGDKDAARAYGLVWDMVDEAECFILDQDPGSMAEAVAILDVLLDGEPQRSDGRDHRALRRVRDRLVSEAGRSDG